MTLLSDSSMNMFPSNIQSEFTVKLDHLIEIDEESKRKAMNRNWYNQKANPALNTKAGNK